MRGRVPVVGHEALLPQSGARSALDGTDEPAIIRRIGADRALPPRYFSDARLPKHPLGSACGACFTLDALRRACPAALRPLPVCGTVSPSSNRPPGSPHGTSEPKESTMKTIKTTTLAFVAAAALGALSLTAAP